MLEALRLAAERYGDRITVNGTVEFKAQAIRAAVDGKLAITFADPALEKRRQALLQDHRRLRRKGWQLHRRPRRVSWLVAKPSYEPS